MANENAPSNNPSASTDAGLSAAEEQAKQAAAGALDENGNNDGGSSDAGSAPTSESNPLEQELQQVQKSYDSLRGEYTRSTQARADLQRQLATLQEKQTEMIESIATLSQGPHDPD